MAKAIRRLDADATTVAFNDGRAAGQEVPHVHCHVVPRWDGDGAGPIHAMGWERPDLPVDELSKGEVGEVIVSTNDHPVWAWNDTEKNAAAFTDGQWYSGDLGYKDEDGYLFLEGRKDFMITSGGMKVFPCRSRND